jgi:hypothetical protein
VFTADLQWDDFLNDYFGAMGLPPSTDPDPTLPPYPVPLSNSVYVPVTLRANVAGW